MRPIDADKVISDLTAMKDVAGFDAVLIDGMIDGLKSQAMIDAVEVIRCKYCINSRITNNGKRYCKNPLGHYGCLQVNDNWFCNFGERRKNEAD